MFGAAISAAAAAQGAAIGNLEEKAFQERYANASPSEQQRMLAVRAEQAAERRHEELMDAAKDRGDGGFAKGLFWGWWLGR